MSHATDNGYNLLNPDLVITERFKGRLTNMLKGVERELGYWLTSDILSDGKRARLQKNVRFSMGRLEAFLVSYMDLTDDVTLDRLQGTFDVSTYFDLSTLANLTNRPNDLKFARSILADWSQRVQGAVSA